MALAEPEPSWRLCRETFLYFNFMKQGKERVDNCGLAVKGDSISL